MGLKRIDVRVTDSTLSTVKKRAVSEGKTVSEFIREMLEFVLDNPSGSRDESGVRSSWPIGMDTIPEAVSEAVMEVLKREGSGVPPEVLRYLVQDTAKTENLLRQISRLLSPGNFKEHAERVRIGEHKSGRILKNLKLDSIEDVDRIEMKVLTKEESDQMLKEMGIGVEGKVMGAGSEK